MKLVIAILNFFSGLWGKRRVRKGTSDGQTIDEVAVPKDNYPLF